MADLETIVTRSARILEVPIDPATARRRSRAAAAARRASPTDCCGACATSRQVRAQGAIDAGRSPA
jgi:hypothetical protein